MKTEIFSKYISIIDNAAKDSGIKKLLIDLSRVAMPANESTRYFTAKHAAEVWSYHYRIATVMNPEDHTRFAENVAANRGTYVSVFYDDEDAVNRLLQD